MFNNSYVPAPGYTVYFKDGTKSWWPAECVEVDASGALWVLDAASNPFAVINSSQWLKVLDEGGPKEEEEYEEDQDTNIRI